MEDSLGRGLQSQLSVTKVKGKPLSIDTFFFLFEIEYKLILISHLPLKKQDFTFE